MHNKRKTRIVKAETLGGKVSQVVEETERDPKQHVDDSQDHRHLHLKRVQERQLVGGNVPDLMDKMVNNQYCHWEWLFLLFSPLLSSTLSYKYTLLTFSFKQTT